MINDIYDELLYKVQFITNNPQYKDDLVNEAILMFLEKPYEVQQKIVDDRKLSEYIYTMMKMQFNSSNSIFHQKYRENQSLKYYYVDENNIDIPEFIEDPHNTNELSVIMSSINKVCDTFEKQLIVDRYLEDKTYQEIAQKYGWTTFNITNKIKEIANKIKQYTYANL